MPARQRRPGAGLQVARRRASWAALASTPTARAVGARRSASTRMTSAAIGSTMIAPCSDGPHNCERMADLRVETRLLLPALGRIGPVQQRDRHHEAVVVEQRVHLQRRRRLQVNFGGEFDRQRGAEATRELHRRDVRKAAARSLGAHAERGRLRRAAADGGPRFKTRRPAFGAAHDMFQRGYVGVVKRESSDDGVRALRQRERGQQW